MNQKQKTLGQENETNKREAETQASKQLDGTQNDSSFKIVSDEQEVNAHKVMIKLTKRMLSLCVNLLLHGIGIVLQHLLGGNKSANSSYCQLPILTLNVARKEH